MTRIADTSSTDFCTELPDSNRQSEKGLFSTKY